MHPMSRRKPQISDLVPDIHRIGIMRDNSGDLHLATLVRKVVSLFVIRYGK